MKEFNIVIAGVGGQGIITLSKIISNAAFSEGLDVKTSELHGLSQRWGGVESHIRFGEIINSSIVKAGKADLIIATEPLEALRSAIKFANEYTIILYESEKIIPISISTEKVKYPDVDAELKKISKNVFNVNGTEIVLKETGMPEMLNIYLAAYAAKKNLFPLKEKSIKDAVEKIISKKYLGICRKVFDLANK